MTRLAVVGAGVMGEALVRGLLSAGWSGSDIVISDVRTDRLEELAGRLGVGTASSNEEAVHGVKAVLLAVKPQDARDALTTVTGTDDATVLSIVAGLRTAAIAEAIGRPAQVVRAMPNTPARVGRGVTALAAGEHADEDARRLAADVFSCVGPVVWLDEESLDAVTAVSGSGPAYLFYLAESMLEAAGRVGLPEDVARTLVVATLRGSAEMLDGPDDPRLLREQVTSKGGTTEAAVAVLESQGVRAAIVEAVAAAARRSKELGS